MVWIPLPPLPFQSTCPARGTTVRTLNSGVTSRFQSTCPARGTTAAVALIMLVIGHFNPRAPRGARLAPRAQLLLCKAISIHVPREGHDFCSRLHACPVCHFNPRAPRGARLEARGNSSVCAYISIHVPREGHDHNRTHAQRGEVFQSTCPARGTTLSVLRVVVLDMLFQSTCPARGTTKKHQQTNAESQFQSTCPARGTTAERAEV